MPTLKTRTLINGINNGDNHNNNKNNVMVSEVAVKSCSCITTISAYVLFSDNTRGVYRFCYIDNNNNNNDNNNNIVVVDSMS